MEFAFVDHDLANFELDRLDLCLEMKVRQGDCLVGITNMPDSYVRPKRSRLFCPSQFFTCRLERREHRLNMIRTVLKSDPEYTRSGCSRKDAGSRKPQIERRMPGTDLRNPEL